MKRTVPIRIVRRLESRTTEGVALFEVVIGITLLAIIFFPIANLLISTSQSTTIAQQKTVGYPIVSGQLSSYLSMVATSTTGPVTTTGQFPGLANVSSSATTFPSGSIISDGTATTWPQSLTVGSNTYSITAVGGWCVQASATSGWSSATSSITPYSTQYFVAVKVAWDTTSRGYSVNLIESSPAASQPSWNLPTTAQAQAGIGGCPVGLS